MNEKNINDENWVLTKTNRFVFTMNAVIDVTLAAGYIVDLLKGRMPLARLLIFLVFLIVQQAVNISFFFRDRSSERFKYAALIGYAAVYAYAIFASAAYFTYVFIFPVTVLYILYYDVRLVKIIGVATGILNILKIVFQVRAGYTSQDDITGYTVQAAVVVLLCVGMHLITKLSLLMNNEKIQQVLKISATLENNAQTLRENIFEQNAKTGEIVGLTGRISSVSEELNEISRNAGSVLKSVISGVQNLNIETVKVTDSTVNVYKNIEILKNLTGDISKNVKNISDVAANTNMLALNASVEAARAGEANKGFSAVAEEIRSLAIKSTESANNIREIIDTLSENSSQAFKEAGVLSEHNSAQNKAFAAVETSLNEIENEIYKLFERIRNIDHDLKDLSAANQEIVVCGERMTEIAELSPSE